MRIFTAVRHSIDPIHYYGGLWSANFYPALRQLGHEIVESQVDLLPASRFYQIPDNFTPQEQAVRSQITQQIVNEVRQAHQQKPVNLFLSYFYNSHFDPAGFAEIHQIGIPTVNFFCNSIYQFDLVSHIASKARFSWHTEKLARELYLHVGANPVWIQMGADPEVYHPVTSNPRKPKACFVGNRYADRDRLLVQLIISQIPVEIYGSGWLYASPASSTLKSPEQPEIEYLGRPILQPGSFESYAHSSWNNLKKRGLIAGVKQTIDQLRYRNESRALAPVIAGAFRGFADNISETFSQYEVVLNFSQVWSDGYPCSNLIPHVRLRDFEAPMCRTCYLTGFTDEIADLYDIGREIDVYHDAQELGQKIKFYLSYPQKAKSLREAGYQRAIKEHTWKNRFEALFKKIGVERC